MRRIGVRMVTVGMIAVIVMVVQRLFPIAEQKNTGKDGTDSTNYHGNFSEENH